MPKKLDYYENLAKDMIAADRQRDNANLYYDKLDHNDWSLPPEMNKAWHRTVIDTGPSTDISAATHVLSALTENVTIQPLASNQSTKDMVNDWERALKWVMDQVNRRRQGTVRQSIVRSAIKYDEVAAQVVDLDFQIAQKNIFGGDSQRENAARRHYGRFVVITYHPNDVHVRYSDLMPEAVLLCQKKKAQAVLDEWGQKVSRKTSLREIAERDDEVLYYDYTDYHDRVVWCTPENAGGSLVEIIRAEHELPFLPWIARVGGDTMEHKAEFRRRPMLYQDWTSGSWETMNVAKSLAYSEVIAYAAAPRAKEEGPTPVEGRTTQTDYGDVNKKVDVSPLNTYTQLPPPPIDQGLLVVLDRMAGERSQGTLSQVLKGGDTPAGISFAALNLATLTATGALKPAKELAELAIADVYAQFMYWANHTGNDIASYGSGQTAGQNYVIEANAFTPEDLYIQVELKPDVALDRQQRANTAAMLINLGLMSNEQAMEYMGETDPGAIQKQIYKEQLYKAYFQTVVIPTMQLGVQQQQMEMQQQAQMAQMQAQGGGGPPPGMENIQNLMAGAPGGQPNNPAQGGLPAQMAAPGATMEGVTGTSRMGNPAFGPSQGGI